MNEQDRPTFNTLRYLTKVKPHRIQRDPWLVDEYVKETLEHDLGVDVVEEFGTYTRSFYTLEGHYQNLWNYDRRTLAKPTDWRLDIAIEQTAIDFRLNNKAVSYGWNELAKIPFIPSSSAGWGFIGKKGDPGNLESAINRAVFSLNMWLEDRARTVKLFRYHPDLAWTRTQLGTPESPKIRSVWGTAFDNILIEGITAAPLIKEYRKKGTPMAVGMNYYKRLPSMINSCLYKNDVYKYGIGIDIKSFDSSIQPWLIDEAFNILKQNLIFKDWQAEESFEYSRYFFIHRPVVMPDGRMWLKHIGIPSGSYFTQLVGSISNMIATHYAQLCTYDQTFETFVLGDDSLFGIPERFGYPTIEQFVPHYAYLGMTVHPDKGCIATRADQLEFLGHCARGSKVDRETASLMRLALYPEYPVSGPAMSMNRVRGIMLDSACNSWGITHLYNTMKTRYRRELEHNKDDLLGTDKDWLIAVLGITNPPSEISEVTTFTLT